MKISIVTVYKSAHRGLSLPFIRNCGEDSKARLLIARRIAPDGRSVALHGVPADIGLNGYTVIVLHMSVSYNLASPRAQLCPDTGGKR